MIPFLPDAQQELDSAIAWYETERQGLGLEFLDQVINGINRIENNPDAHRLLRADIRRCLLRRFPFGLVFRCNGPLVIVAVMHLHRDPDYWEKRV